MHPEFLEQPLSLQFSTLLLLGLAVSCVTWTITHEEIFREPREFCKDRSQTCRRLYQRKFFYLFTCEYCFSHYVAALFFSSDPVPDALHRLAWFCDLGVCPGLDCEHLYERV